MEDHRVKQKAQRPLVFLQNKFQKETGEILPRWVFKNLIKRYGFNKVIDCLKEMDFSNSDNPIAFLTAAIKNGWRVFKEPEYLKQYEIEKAEEIKQAEILRASRIPREYKDKEYLRRQELRRQREILEGRDNDRS